jgi:hypothetical protein
VFTIHRSSLVRLTVVVGVFGLLILGQAGVGAQVSQTSPGGGAPAVSDQNCAVSTTRIGSVDVTRSSERAAVRRVSPKTLPHHPVRLRGTKRCRLQLSAAFGSR